METQQHRFYLSAGHPQGIAHTPRTPSTVAVVIAVTIFSSFTNS
ncbi:MAG TPA: hypothetical protein VF669_22420 [Tepidisphaeraceae bacterium]|jgi:hypothetical protein